ncbi:hypothetical protein [Streptomyces sp. 769]|uniref:hypothetical protein n=1 Tax=Streptomyces sp. 769 TaxID=1262452 RepID=UPI00057D6749|nr:hypothetical protein [Streptomyces sp. 769]
MRILLSLRSLDVGGDTGGAVEGGAEGRRTTAGEEDRLLLAASSVAGFRAPCGTPGGAPCGAKSTSPGVRRPLVVHVELAQAVIPASPAVSSRFRSVGEQREEVRSSASRSTVTSP